MKFYAGVGSRETPKELIPLIKEVALKLERDGYTLRSGGAEGADTFFDVVEDKKIYLPWSGFEGKVADGEKYIDSQKLSTFQEAYNRTAEFHPNWFKLKPGARLMMARNFMQCFGTDLKTPSKFVICWTRDGGPTGGTGQAIRIAEHYKIPIYNLYFKEVRERFEKYVSNGL